MGKECNKLTSWNCIQKYSPQQFKLLIGKSNKELQPIKPLLPFNSFNSDQARDQKWIEKVFTMNSFLLKMYQLSKNGLHTYIKEMDEQKKLRCAVIMG